jgi:hypothetical protein
MNITPYSIIIGVRFKPVLKLSDQAGGIFDSVIEKKRFFHEDYFTQLQYSGFEKTINNPDTGNSIRMTTDNLIYTQTNQENKPLSYVYSLVQERFNGTVVPIIIDGFSLNISRIGIVFTYSIAEELRKKVIHKYFLSNVSVNEFRFTVSNGIPDNALDKNSSDYENKIVTLSKDSDKNIYKISFDYQNHFKPLRPCWRDSNADKFFCHSKEQFEHEYD